MGKSRFVLEHAGCLNKLTVSVLRNSKLTCFYERALGPPSLCQGYLVLCPVLKRPCLSQMDLQFNLGVFLLSQCPLRFLQTFWDPRLAWWPIGEVRGDCLRLPLSFLLIREVGRLLTKPVGSKAMKCFPF